MRKLVALTLVAFVAVLGDIGTSTAQASVKKHVGISCPGIVKGVHYYRNAAWKWQDKLAISRTRSSFVAKRTYSCRYATWVAHRWQKRAKRLRVEFHRSFKHANPNVVIGNQMARAYGWHRGSEWSALYKLWNHESGWNTHADNPRSDACGIPQRMNNCREGHDPRVQIRWGLNYIKGRYKRPSSAYAHLRSQNWY